MKLKEFLKVDLNTFVLEPSFYIETEETGAAFNLLIQHNRYELTINGMVFSPNEFEDMAFLMIKLAAMNKNGN